MREDCALPAVEGKSRYGSESPARTVWLKDPNGGACSLFRRETPEVGPRPARSC